MPATISSVREWRAEKNPMQIALMVPCYIDLFYREVGVATLELLEKLKVDVIYPFDQTCCGQPMACPPAVAPIICGTNSLLRLIHRSAERSRQAFTTSQNFYATFCKYA